MASEREIVSRLIGNSVVSVTDDTMMLSDGTRLRFAKENSECCSWIELSSLNTTDSIITAAEFRDNEDQTGGEGGYSAWLYVMTEAGSINIAEAEGNASNGYYLHGFALDVQIIPAS